MTPEREAELREAHRLMPSPLSTELFAEIDRLRAELGALKAADNPEFDATDGAHPAWWRAHDYVSARFKEELDKSRRERDDLKAKLDAELPAMWREDIQSLNECLERLGEELRDVRKERDDLKADFESMEYDAAKVVRALIEGDPDDVRVAVEAMRDNGRPGWWGPTGVTRP